MAAAPRGALPSLAAPPGGRMLEWSLLSLVVLVIAGALGYYGRQVQAYGERASMLTTLGALRTALAVDHLQQATRMVPGVAATVPPTVAINPFLLLKTPPPNYRGELSAVESFSAAPGAWVFDPRCPCVGYRPMDAGGVIAAQNPAWLWFTVSAGPSPHQLMAREPYVWRGLEVR